jgi:hypothetical protein
MSLTKSLCRPNRFFSPIRYAVDCPEPVQTVMTDIIAVLGTVALFLLSLLYVLGCERLK